MSNSLHHLYVAHIEWQGRRKTLGGQERRFLHRWVARTYPTLVAACGGGAQFRQQCIEVQRGGKVPTTLGIGMATFNRYSEPLVAVYLSAQDFHGKPFSEFLATVQRRCRTEAELVRWLTKESGHP